MSSLRVSPQRHFSQYFIKSVTHLWTVPALNDYRNHRSSRIITTLPNDEVQQLIYSYFIFSCLPAFPLIALVFSIVWDSSCRRLQEVGSKISPSCSELPSVRSCKPPRMEASQPLWAAGTGILIGESRLLSKPLLSRFVPVACCPAAQHQRAEPGSGSSVPSP